MSQSYLLQPPFADASVEDSRSSQLGISGSGDASLLSGDKMRVHSSLADCKHKEDNRRETSDIEMSSSMSLARNRGSGKSLSEIQPPLPGYGSDLRVSEGESGSLQLYHLNDKELSTRSLQALSLHIRCPFTLLSSCNMLLFEEKHWCFTYIVQISNHCRALKAFDHKAASIHKIILTSFVSICSAVL
jgi:hypothetical protein